jgi:hypothetical protein
VLGDGPCSQRPCIIYFNLNEQLDDVPGDHHVTLSDVAFTSCVVGRARSSPPRR